MQTFSYVPRPPLSSLVELIWVSRAGSFNYANRTLPMLHHELVINFSERFEVTLPGRTVVADAPAWVSGLQTRPLQTITAGRHFTAGILFKPWGLRAFTPVDAAAVQDQILPPEELFGPTARHLAEAVYAAQSREELFARVEDFLAERLLTSNPPSLLVGSIALINGIPLSGNVVNRLAGTFGVSAKTLIGHFKKYIGLTPAKYHHLVVLNRLLQYLAQNPGESLTRVAYGLDFFDQAHLVHFFRQYTGLTPSAYLRAHRAGKVHPASPNAIEI
jgi:AraC-like DNA-binding protein